MSLIIKLIKNCLFFFQFNEKTEVTRYSSFFVCLIHSVIHSFCGYIDFLLKFLFKSGRISDSSISDAVPDRGRYAYP